MTIQDLRIVRITNVIHIRSPSFMDTLFGPQDRLGNHSPKGWRGLKNHLTHTLVHEWPAALFVAGLVGIAHAHLPWLKRVEFSMLASVAELGARVASPIAFDPRVWIYTIDRTEFETRYEGRTPLGRCKLEEDLVLIYTAIDEHNKAQTSRATEATSHPSVAIATEGALAAQRIDLLVIDLDLSPITRPTPDEVHCQSALEERLHKWRNPPDRSVAPMQIVLMQPSDVEINGHAREWVDGMQRRNMLFGDVRYPIREDMAVYYYCDPASLAAKAYYAAGGAGTDCLNQTAANIRKIHCRDPCPPGTVPYREREDELRIEDQEFIDPIKYKKQIDFKAMRPGTNDRSSTFTNSESSESSAPVKAVFFGVDLDADSHSTPIGVLSGVQINAATFLSLFDPISSEHHFVGFAVDVAIGLAFALLITLFWKFFFEDRVTSDLAGQTMAGMWLVGLGFVGTALLILFTYASAWAFRHGVWFSPLPIALGMLFDAAIAGSVTHVIERDGGTHGPVSLAKSVTDLIGGRLIALSRDGYYLAATVEASYLAVWIAVLVCGIHPEFLKGFFLWLRGILP